VHQAYVRIGFVVNPYAGMGGPLGLKGTDGRAREEAMGRGAIPTAPERAIAALRAAMPLAGVDILTASGPMGEDELSELGLDHRIAYVTEGMTDGDDTTNACRRFLAEKVDLIVFCGGDGTAIDVMDAVGSAVPVIGIPSGVKMHSGVFATTPRTAGELLRRFLDGSIGTKEGEVMDIDEVAFRSDRLQATLKGYMLVPDEAQLMQPPKGTVALSGDDEEKEALGEYFQLLLEWGTLYILGPGTTVRALAQALGEEKTILGVDALLDRKVIAKDLDEAGLMRLVEANERVKIVVTPIGAQGFVFGRGNQQISPKVIRRVGLENIIVVATPSKLSGIRALRVDTGDPELDGELGGYRRVIVGYGKEKVMPVR
jgi:predicted polyphosphate/ATP-dependent NAD kinase